MTTQQFACRPSEIPLGDLGGPALIGSRLRKIEREIVAAGIVSVCRDGDTWRPVNAREWGHSIGNTPTFRMSSQEVINAMWAMVDEGLLIMDTTSDVQTMMPTPALVELIK